MSLKEKGMQANSNKGIEFMEGRQKGENMQIEGLIVNVIDFDFIDDPARGEYSVYIVKEDETNFFFGGKILTDFFKGLTPEEKEELQENGLPIRITTGKKSKNGYQYTGIEFYPEAK